MSEAADLLHPEPFEVIADAEQIAFQQLPGVPVLAGIDRLRQVDERRLSIPDQDVVRREIAVDDVAVEEQLDVAHHLTQQFLGLVGIGAVAAQLRRGVVLVADVGHEEARGRIA